MWMHVMLSAVTTICMIGCAVGTDQVIREATNSANQAEINCLAQDQARPKVGIALAGGGTKAASYSMGVLAAATSNGLGQIGAISSVSGGSYAAFFLYSKLLADKDNLTEYSVLKYFDDCIPGIYQSVLPKNTTSSGFALPLCNKEKENKEDGDPRYPFQQFIRCRQDVLESDCNQQLHSDEYDEYAAAAANTVPMVALTIMMSAPNLITCSLFDWPINLSPTRSAYMQGIGTAYGLYPLDSSAISKQTNIVANCNEDAFLNCENSLGSARLKRKGMGFSQLRNLTQTNSWVPIWFINAAASPDRSIVGWAQKGKRDFTKYTLQMSPFTACSGLYGEIPDYERYMDLLEAVTTSAAFLDANETCLEQPGRFLAGAAQHFFATDWGIDIPNPNVPEWQRVVHAVLPFPFYWLDSLKRTEQDANGNQKSVYIRLMDGGNNDNLGAYTLINAGMKEIIISDHSHDRKVAHNNEELATMNDLCLLKNEIAVRSGGNCTLHIPGLDKFEQHCLASIDESECIEWEDKLLLSNPCRKVPGVKGEPLTGGGYPIFEWKYPVLVGCITAADTDSGTCDNPNDVRLYILKPAFDRESIKNHYLEEYTAGNEKKYRVKKEACTKDSIPGICEVAAFIAYGHNHKNFRKDHGIWQFFPQDGTAIMTYASSGKMYGAYRELARWHMHEALRILSTENEFNEKLKTQSKHPIHRKPL